MIGQQLFIQHLNASVTQKAVDWPSRYCCFESSCRPVDHVQDCDKDLLDRALATVRNHHPHLADATSPDGLREFNSLVDDSFQAICSLNNINLTTRKWFGIHGWTAAMSDQREGELPHYRAVSTTRFHHFRPCLTLMEAHPEVLRPGALYHA
jgi:hypothetical protein